MSIVLASTSRHRRALMDRLGVAYEVAAPRCHERLDAPMHPRRATRELAERKARSVAAEHSGCIIVGADQMAWIDDTVLGKPGTEQAAVDQLVRLSGRTHELWTAVAVLCPRAPGGLQTDVQVWRLTMRALTPAQARAYVRADGPLDCAGSYRFESGGAALFTALEGEDPTAVSGLPLMSLVAMLQRCGCDPLDDAAAGGSES
jgi:septum formation protein